MATVKGVVRKINHHENGVHIEVNLSEPVQMLQFPFTTELIDDLFTKPKMVAIPATPRIASQFSAGQKVSLVIDLGPDGKPFCQIFERAGDD